jgi:hypothetical protein
VDALIRPEIVGKDIISGCFLPHRLLYCLIVF